MNIGTPVVFYWTNNVELAGIVCSSRVENSITYFNVALFDPGNVGPGNYYPSAVSDSSKNAGTIQIYSAAQ